MDEDDGKIRSKKYNNHKTTTIIKWVMGAAIVIAIVVILWLLLKGNETRTSDRVDNSNLVSLHCNTSTEPEGSPYNTGNALNTNHIIKVLFKSKGIDGISYSYEGDYGSKNAANIASANFLSTYYEKMSSSGLDYNTFNATTADTDSKANFSLHANFVKIKRTVASLFFITPNEYDILDTSSINVIQKLYESKGFKCKVSD